MFLQGMKKSQKPNRNQRGGVAMEYIIVSTCAALLAISATAFAIHSFKQKMDELAEQLGIEKEAAAVSLPTLRF